MERLVLDQAAINQLFTSPEGPAAIILARKAVQVEAKAKRACPVDTGRLRASLTHNLERDSRGLVAFVGTNVNYAAHVEFGTKHQRPQPYLRPALRGVS